MQATCTCLECGKAFQPRHGDRRRKYCGPGCFSIGQRRQREGATTIFHVLDEEKERAIVSSYRDGQGGPKIAETFGVSYRTVYRVLRKHGIARRSHSDAKKALYEQCPEIILKMAKTKRDKNGGPKSSDMAEGSGSWDNRVKRRDDYTCQDCGLRDPEVVNAHHIVPVVTDPSLTWVLRNGVTLCCNCHKRRHNRMKKLGLGKPLNRLLAFNGVAKTELEWAKITGISPATIRTRIRLGWSVEDTLTKLPGERIREISG